MRKRKQPFAAESSDENIRADPGVVDGNDAEKTAGVEGGEVARRIFGIEQNSADEKTGEDEKKIHTGPTENYETL